MNVIPEWELFSLAEVSLYAEECYRSWQGMQAEYMVPCHLPIYILLYRIQLIFVLPIMIDAGKIWMV